MQPLQDMVKLGHGPQLLGAKIAIMEIYVFAPLIPSKLEIQSVLFALNWYHSCPIFIDKVVAPILVIMTKEI